MRLFDLPGSPLWRLRRSLERPERAQIDLLRRLIRRSAATAWGREHGYGEIHAHPDPVSEYQTRVPRNDHAALAPYVSRVCRGEPDVLWPGRTTIFAVSGGTESGGRAVPISRDGMRFLRRASLAPGWSYLERSGNAADLLRGKVLSLPGGVSHGTFGPGSITGEVSGLMAYHAPAVTRRWQALPSDVMYLEDWNRKLAESARIAARRDVRAIIMVPSWAAAFLDRVRDEVGAPTARDAVRRVWPGLRAFFSGGVSLASYREVLRSYLGPDVALLESYSASEGFFAFQDAPESDDLQLHLESGVFYEFVPLEERGRPMPSRLTLGSVESGVDYVLHVSTASGLWSCATDDVVRFTCTRPPRLRVVGRAREVLDRFGEAMSREHVVSAIADADAACSALCLHFHVTYAEPLDPAAPRHHWILEHESAPPDAAAYAGALDDAAKRHNGRYRKRREPGAFGPPVVTLVPRGTTQRYLEQERRRFGPQSKLGALSEERTVAGTLLAVARALDGAAILEVSPGAVPR